MSSFIAKLQKRLRSEESGFTLIELLIVLVIIGILLAIAVPSYLGFKDRAKKSAAQANVRSAVPAVEAYYADHGDYVFTTRVAPRPASAPSLAGDRRRRQARPSRRQSAARYCISDTQGNYPYHKTGPAATSPPAPARKTSRYIARSERARSNPRPLSSVTLPVRAWTRYRKMFP